MAEKPAGTDTAKDSLQERLIDAEYKIWKKNTPYLYDFVLTHSLEWPSLTCQWLPTKRILSKKCVEHQLLLGTHTMGEQNFLMVATALLPSNDDEVVVGDVTSLRYDEERKEVGGFGLAGPDVGKVDIKMKIRHEGEVNRARYMPQNHFIVATRGPSPELYVWDLSKHPSVPDSKYPPFAPQGVCFGHEKEGYALAWSPFHEGKLLSGSDDSSVLLFDVQQAYTDKKVGTQIRASSTFQAHTAAVEDVAWHYKDANMAGTVGDDKLLCIWDIRTPEKPVKSVKDAHASDINCIAFNPVNEFVLATGSADSSIGIWDLRDTTKPIANLEGHTDQVFKLEWAPFNESILGSCSADRRVAIWDLSRIGQEQTPEDAEDGPPELLFLHGGHTSKVSEFTWNGKKNWSVASVSEDNVLQVWSPVEEIYADEDDDEADDEKKEDAVPDDELES